MRHLITTIILLTGLWAWPAMATTFWDDELESGTGSPYNDIIPNTCFGASNAFDTVNKISGAASLKLSYPGAAYHQQCGGFEDRSFGTTTDDLWSRFYVRLSPGFVGDSIQTKVMRNDPSGSGFVSYWWGMRGGSTSLDVQGQGVYNGTDPTTNYPANLGSGDLRTNPQGGFVCIETHIRNNTVDQANGLIEAYKNGSPTPYLRYTGIRQRVAGQPSEFDHFGSNRLFRQDAGGNGISSINYDRLAFGNTRINCLGSVPPQPVDTIPPSTPGTLSAVGGSLSVSLSHGASTDANPITYLHERCSGASCSNFVLIDSSTTTAFTHAGLAANTSYSFRVRAQDPAGNLSGYSNTATATTAAAGAGSFSSNATGQFVLNSVQTFGLFASYFDSVNWRSADLDYLATNGFNGIRSWATWNVGVYGATRSVCDSAGALQATQRDTVQAMIDYAKTKNMVVQLVIMDAGAGALLATNAARLACITNVVNYYKPTSAQANWNVFFDVENEHNDPAGTWGDTAAEMRTFTAAAFAAWPGGMIAASCTNGDGSAFCGPSDSTSALGATAIANINTKIVTNGERFFQPHENRSTNWWSVTGARVAAYRAYLASIGRSSIPVFFGEPNRRGSTQDSTEAQFNTAAVDAKAAGAAGWVFHTDAGFDLSSSSFVAQLDATEAAITLSIANSLAGSPGSGTTPTALAGGSDDFNRANSTELGAAWNQPFTSHVSAQIVGNRLRALNTTSGNGGESIEIYAGVTPPNNQGATIELATVSGTSPQWGQLRVRHSDVPAENGYVCEWTTNPSTAQIRKKTAGGGSSLAPAGAALSVSTWTASDVIGCFASGSTIYMTRGSITSTPILSVTDTTYGSGKAGLYIYTGTSPVANWEFDDFIIYEYTTPPPLCTPSISTAVADATGATVAWSAACPPTQIRVRWNTGSEIKGLSFFPGGRYTKVGGWAPGTTSECFDPIDAQGVVNMAGTICSNYVAAYDQAAPTLSNGLPSAPLPAGTTSRLISLNSNKVATCKYDTTDTTYALMANTMSFASLKASATVTGLTNGSTTTYYARCNFVDIFGVNHPNLTSLVITVVVDSSTVDTTLPSTVTGLVGTPLSESQVELRWTASTDDVLVTGYQAYECPTVACATLTLDGVPTEELTIITDVSPGSTSFFCVKSIDSSNNIAAACSNVATVTTPSILDVTPPSDMTNLSKLAAFTLSVLLTWDLGTDNMGSVSTNIEQCQGASCTDFALVPPGGIQGQTLLTNLLADTLYRFRGKHCDFAVPVNNCSVNYSNILEVTTNATGLGQPRLPADERSAADRLPAGTRLERTP